jgi:outer membrane lipoprotein-sorting protein
MKTIIRTSVIAFGLAVLLGGFAVSETNAQPLKEILDRMDTHHKALSSLQADVTMVKQNAQLGETDTSQGSTSFLPKTAKRVMYVRVDWTKPLVENIVVIGDDYKLFRPRLNQVIVGKASKAKNSSSAGGALAFMSMSKEQLKANYTVKYHGPETLSNGTETWHLELIPKSATSYKAAELWVDKNGMPIQAKVIESNNDTTTVLLSNLKKNITLNADIFRLKYPKSVKEIKG